MGAVMPSQIYSCQEFDHKRRLLETSPWPQKMAFPLLIILRGGFVKVDTLQMIPGAELNICSEMRISARTEAPEKRLVHPECEQLRPLGDNAM
jgi:hypothetical protein